MSPRPRLKRRSRGFALATLLMIVFLLLVFGLTLADLTTSAYQLSYQASEQTRALELAQAGVAEAIDKLTANQAAYPGTTSFTDSLDTTGNYTVTIANNLGAATPTGGVPPYTAQLDSVSTVLSGRTVHLQVLVQYASYPYAIAGYTGVQTGPLTVTGATSLSALLGGQTSTQGNVYSGGPGATSLTAAAGTSITGRARSVGGVAIANPSTITQGIDQDITPDTMPSLDLASFNTQNTPGVTVYNSEQRVVGPLAGPVYCDGNLYLMAPVLADAQIYVTGNLQITGTLLGTGSIFVGGTTTINCAISSMASTNGIAVFSQGDLSIGGTMIFQGVLFTQGNLNFTGPGVTVIGAAIAGQQVTSSDPVSVTYVPEYTQFGSTWSSQGMLGSVLAGPAPLLKVMFWTQVS